MENRWIPVTERLPEDFEEVLVYRRDGDMDIAYHRTDEHHWCFPTDDDRWLPEDNDRPWSIVAWTPLPEPYKEEVYA